MEHSSAQQAASSARGTAGFQDVNPHCLGHIVELSDTHQITAADDIHDEAGIKLWARGAPVSRELRERLLHRRLSRPLEANLTVEDGATMRLIIADALTHIDGNEALSALAGSSGARGLLRDVQGVPLQGPVKLLLTSARKSGKATYMHSLSAMIVSAGVAYRLGMAPGDANALILAALLHDIGEMYINPDYLDSSRTLPPVAWKHVASHPCIGHAFIREFTTFPAGIAASVLHHHERQDGSGYPFQRQAAELDRNSRILAVADAVSAIVMRGGSGIRQRIEIALRIIPEEFDRSAASAVNAALAGLPLETCGETTDNCIGRVAPVLHQLAAANAVAEQLVTTACSAVSGATGDYARSVLGHIGKSLRATGLVDSAQLQTFDDDPALIAEVCLIVGEVSWRMRNLARNLQLRVERDGNRDDAGRVAGLLTVLDPAIPTMH